jgi:hypothetical protein
MGVIHDSYGRGIGSDNPLAVITTGDSVAEQKTQTQAVAGVVTFLKVIQQLEIYNTDAVNDGVFIVNGIDITVPKGEVFKAKFGGTPSVDVTISGSTSYILTRYE